MAGTYRSRDSSTRVASKIQSIGGSVSRSKRKASKLSSSAGAKASRENKINNAVKKKYTGTKSKVSKKSRW